MSEQAEHASGSWTDGYPPNPWDKEWFIAITIDGDRVVLKALPEEFSFDFTTGDGTYFKKRNIAKWMQFPDSEFVNPNPMFAAAPDLLEACKKANDFFIAICEEYASRLVGLEDIPSFEPFKSLGATIAAAITKAEGET